MHTTAIQSYSELKKLLPGEGQAFLLLYKGGSEQSDCAMERLGRIEAKAQGPVFTADVSTVRDIHGNLGVDTAPSLVNFHDGRVNNIIKGCQTEASYEAILSGTRIGQLNTGEPGKAKQVTVYTTPTCTWCTTLKTYLDQQKVQYREVNVASDTSAAEAMVQKSGQQGVPQTEINGQMIVGFDKNRINQLLEIQ